MTTAQTHKIFRYPLVLGLPHTNLNLLAEPPLLMYAGHFQWNSIATSLGRPLSEFRTKEGKAIYATFFYVEEDYPDRALPNRFDLDQELVFLNHLRQYKGMSIDGHLVFGYPSDVTPEISEALVEAPESLRGRLPYLRMCNVFISRVTDNAFLKLTSPENARFDAIDPLDPDQNAYGLTRDAQREGRFDLFDKGWSLLDRRPDFCFEYALNPDRDTNGAGLIYFANYVSFMDMAERAALGSNVSQKFTEDELLYRTIRRRKLAYYGNVKLNDGLRIYVSVFSKAPQHLGFRYRIVRKSDEQLIALSEAEKILGRPAN